MAITRPVLTSIAIKAPCTCGHLPQGPADEGAVRIRRHGPHMHHIAHRQKITRRFRLFAHRAIEAPLARPCHILRRDEMSVLVFLDAFDADPCVIGADREHDRRIPWAIKLDVPRNAHGGQRFAPACLIGQQRGLDLGAPLAVDTRLAVELLELAPQGFGGNGLHLLIDRGAYGETAGEKLALAEILAQLAANLIGEIVPWRQHFLETLEIAVLHGAKRLIHFYLVDRFRDVAVLLHLPAARNCDGRAGGRSGAPDGSCSGLSAARQGRLPRAEPDRSAAC